MTKSEHTLLLFFVRVCRSQSTIFVNNALAYLEEVCVCVCVCVCLHAGRCNGFVENCWAREMLLVLKFVSGLAERCLPTIPRKTGITASDERLNTDRHSIFERDSHATTFDIGQGYRSLFACSSEW
jgi:hypothetical protein